jgi:hypothetical protein
VSSLDHVWKERRREAEHPRPLTENIAQPALPARRRGHGRIQLIVLASAVAAAALVVAWLFLHRAGSSTPRAAAGSGPALISQSQLQGLAASLDQPVYWAGPRAGYSYEATVARGGRVYVRYLPLGVKAGDPRASFLVVGTYTEPGSFADLKRAAKQGGSVSVGIDRGGLVVFSSQRPTSVYFSYPGAKYQVEVYSPSGNAARSLVLGGKITPIRPAR